MPLVSLIDVALDAGTRRLVSDCHLTIAAGERLAVIGGNGSGKSTLLRLLAGSLEADAGRRRQARDVVTAYVPQEEELPAGITVEEFLLQAAQAGGADAGAIAAGVQRTLAELGAEGGLELDRASGGWRKRAALAAAFLRAPDLLLLDEPTNHLDLAAVRWLEDRLLDAAAPALVVVSHDRWLLQRVATRCMEIGERFPAGHFVAAGDYDTFCQRRDAFLTEQQSRQRKLAEQLRRESAWLARTPKARTGKSAARVEAAGELQAELAQVQRRTGADRSASVAFNASGRRGNELIVTEGLTKAFGQRRCFEDLDLTIAPGDRLGLLGGNGSGKTTLLRVLAGQLEPDAGRLKRAHALGVVYADQHRSELAPEQTVADALAPNGEHVQVGEQRWHVRAWAARHGLREDQLPQPIARLSGGERARVQIARLAVQPADLLLLDEPTNDCDIPLLERLELAIAAHAGAVVLVSHDRYLLERSCTVLLAFDGQGGVRRVASVAAYEDDCRRGAAGPSSATPSTTNSAPSAGLSWDEQRELRALPGRIASAEERLAAIEADLVDPAVCRDQATAARLHKQRDEQQVGLDHLMERWLELDERAT